MTYDSRIPVIIAERLPIPQDTELNNTRYYSSYYPVVDSLYKKLKEGHIVYENKKGEEKQSRDWYFRVPFKYLGILDLSKEKNNFLLPEKKLNNYGRQI